MDIMYVEDRKKPTFTNPDLSWYLMAYNKYKTPEIIIVELNVILELFY